jgi:lysyl-tRNA synthetase class 2
MAGESLEEIRQSRLEKIQELRARGIDPYPEKTPPRTTIGEVLAKFGKIRKAAVAGRIVSMRPHGGIIFVDLKDQSGKMQLIFKKDVLGDRFDLLELFDLGDFIWAEGKLLKTKAGEKSIDAANFMMLAKSLRPVPSEWYGLKDVEERFRRRYLDLLTNEEVKARFRTRSNIIATIRKILEKEGYIEVETPILQPLYGGAAAHPFKTHHRILDIDLYLRIAPELYLKRLLVGGFEKIYEIGRVFRNEGIDREHNPEFTMLELYAAYETREGLMRLCEKLILNLAALLSKKKPLPKPPWQEITFEEVIKRETGLSYNHATKNELMRAGEKHGLSFEPGQVKAKIADEIFKKLFVPKTKEPLFVIDHPVELSPLAKKDTKNPTVVRRFQLLADGWELINGFSELNDPIDQRERFEAQEKNRRAGDEEAMRYDEDFVEALEYGMPPASGLGIGIDRLVAWLTDAPSLKEVILFPMLKPK